MNLEASVFVLSHGKENVFRTGTFVLAKVTHTGKHKDQPGHETLEPVEQNCQLFSFVFLSHSLGFLLAFTSFGLYGL